MAGAPTPQIVCVGGPQDSNCTPLQAPPFQPSPLPPPNNVLVIPTHQQESEGDFCDPNNGRTMISYAEQNYLDNTAFKRSQGLDCSGPQRMVVGDCYAEFDGCELERDGTPTGRSCVGAAWRSGFGPRDRSFHIVHDSDPNWDSELLRGSACPGTPLIIFNPPHDQVPPPSIGPLCHEGSTPTLTPTDTSKCFEQVANGFCPCDPPLPYGGSGPLVEGSPNSTESYFMFAPTPTGIPTAVHDEVDIRAAITPTVPRLRAPIMIPIPTAGIAVTVCNSCGADSSDEELDELA